MNFLKNKISSVDVSVSVSKGQFLCAGEQSIADTWRGIDSRKNLLALLTYNIKNITFKYRLWIWFCVHQVETIKKSIATLKQQTMYM